MTTLAKRLDTHFAACAAAAAGAAVIGGAEKANAAIVYSGVVNITIGGNFSGVYLNMISGLTSLSAGTNVGFDTNPYYGGNRIWSTTLGTNGVRSSGGQALNLAPGTLISGANLDFTTGTVLTTTNFTANVAGLYGLKLVRESDSATLYGWVRLIRGASNTNAGTIVDYAYEGTAGAGIMAGVVPGPGSLALLAIGAAGLRGRRRK